jgi:hypothetical protein
MGSIQEMPSTEMTSESRDIEMRDIEVEGQSDATEAVSKVKQANGISDDAMQPHHVSNGHLTPNKGETTPQNRVDQPLPSVENDDDESSSTAAAEQNKTPEKERRDTILHSSPAQPLRHQTSASVQGPTAAESIKLEKEIARLNEVLAETSAQAAQKVLKDKWRFFLFDTYDEAHISFILRAGFKNATASVTEKVLQDKSLFRELLLDVASRKPTLIEKVITNTTAPQLLRLAPERVLDEAVAERLKTVSAKQLIGWLARAGRLGYEMDDIIDEDDESVVPRAGSFEADMVEVFEVEPAPAPIRPPVPAPVPAQQLASATRDPLLVEQEKNLAAQRLADAARSLKQKQPHQQPPPKPQSRPPPSMTLSCPVCHATLPTVAGYNYHITKKPCQKNPPVANAKWWCNNCMQTFTGKQGMDYHTLKGVCAGEDIARATSPSNQLLQEAASVAQHRPPPVPSQPQAAIPSIPRPSFTPTHPTAYNTHASSAMASQQPLPRPEVTIQRPPLHTPTSTPVSKPSPPVSTSTPGPRGKQAPSSDIRQSPSELSAEKLADLNRELQEADDRYQQQISEIPADATEEQRTARLVSLKNANASRKSQIRKAHGVSLRLREKDKQARKALETTPSGKAAPEQRKSMTSMTSMTSTPPAAAPPSSFSPINTPPPTAPTPGNGRNSNPPQPSQASRYNGPSLNPQNLPQPSQASRYNGPSQNPPQRSHVSPYSQPPTVPTNAPSRPSYSAAANAAHTAANSTYRPPPHNAAERVQSRYMAHDPNTLSHALERPRPSGFGVLRVQDLKSNTAPTSNKRRRSIDDEGRPVPPRTAAVSTPHIDRILAEHRRAQAQPVTGARAENATKRAQTPSSATAPRDTPKTDVPLDPKSKNTLATAIMISSSSDSDSDIPAEPKAKTQPTPTPEKAKKNESASTTESESEKRSSAGPRRGFMAKRGGKH